ncbi:MAG: hypothetical protein LUH51_03530 [Firmicutes bacterium]|nr:hypothetical protein [Bacillota bacterium]
MYGLIEKVDFDTYRAVAQDRLERYFAFLELNGLEHVAQDYVPKYMKNDETNFSDECYQAQNLLEKNRRNIECATFLMKKFLSH